MKIEPKKKRPPRESGVVREIRIGLQRSYPELRLFVNAQAIAEIGGRKFRVGLGPGSPDLVGWIGRAVPSGIDGAWRVIAQFVAFEIKRPGGKAQHPERIARQRAWLDVACRAGCITGMVESLAEAIAVLEAAGIRPSGSAIR